MNVTKELELCTRCKGVGVIYWDELINHHKGEYDTHSEDCKQCNGTGRRYKITTTEVKYVPFGEEN